MPATTPLKARKDALKAAAHMVHALSGLMADDTDTTRFTVGRFECHPGSPATVPSRVLFTIDFRHPDPAVIARIRPNIEPVCQVSAHGCAVSIRSTIDNAPLQFDAAGDRPGGGLRRPPRPLGDADAVGRGPRRRPHQSPLPDRHDLRALRARHHATTRRRTLNPPTSPPAPRRSPPASSISPTGNSHEQAPRASTRPSIPRRSTRLRPVIRGHKHGIVAGHYLAAQAGFAILEAGGNAIDAGCAAGNRLGRRAQRSRQRRRRGAHHPLQREDRAGRDLSAGSAPGPPR